MRRSANISGDIHALASQMRGAQGYPEQFFDTSWYATVNHVTGWQGLDGTPYNGPQRVFQIYNSHDHTYIEWDTACAD